MTMKRLSLSLLVMLVLPGLALSQIVAVARGWIPRYSTAKTLLGGRHRVRSGGSWKTGRSWAKAPPASTAT
jgi:hypothetical protein